MAEGGGLLNSAFRSRLSCSSRKSLKPRNLSAARELSGVGLELVAVGWPRGRVRGQVGHREDDLPPFDRDRVMSIGRSFAARAACSCRRSPETNASHFSSRAVAICSRTPVSESAERRGTQRSLRASASVGAAGSRETSPKLCEAGRRGESAAAKRLGFGQILGPNLVLCRILRELAWTLCEPGPGRGLSEF